MPRVSTADRDRLSRYQLRAGDIVFSRVGSVDRRALVRGAEDGWLFSGRCLRVRPEPWRIDPGYLSYFFGLPAFKRHIRAIAVGATMPSLNTALLSDVAVPYPPDIGEQRAIAQILSALDDKIELHRRMSETLEAMARAIFKSWFIDFDPVTARASGGTADLPHRFADLFPASFDHSTSLPNGWRIESLGGHALNFDSRRIPLSGSQRASRPGPYPYHGAAGVLDHIDGYLFDGVHLLVGEDGSVIHENGTAVTQYVWGQFWVNNHAHVLQGRGPVCTEHLYLFFQFETVAPFVTGAVQPKLSQGRMNTMPFVYAGDAICHAFAQVIAPLFSRIRSAADERRTLATIRDTLLPKLISGEIRIKRAERAIEAVL